jgi:hypothetical protein
MPPRSHFASLGGVRGAGPGLALGDTDRQADVHVAPGGATILALSLGTLRKLAETDPALDLRIVTNAAEALWRRLDDVGPFTS